MLCLSAFELSSRWVPLTLVALSYNRNVGIKVPGSSLVGLAFFSLVIFLLFLLNIIFELF